MDILTILGSASDAGITAKGLSYLQSFGLSYQLRIASAHRSPLFLQEILSNFEAEEGKICICVAGKSAHLGGVVAAHTLKPVICVPIFQAETAGFDALLSMGQMPEGVPVATMGFGKHGFGNACLLATQMLALENPKLTAKLAAFRQNLAAQVVATDSEHRLNFP